MTREELFLKLSNINHEGASRSDAHSESEDALLEFIGDADLTTAWNEYRDEWWYS